MYSIVQYIVVYYNLAYARNLLITLENTKYWIFYVIQYQWITISKDISVKVYSTL